MSGFEDGFCLKRQETSSCMRCLETEPHRRWQRGQVAEKGRARANGKLQMLTLQLHIRQEFQQMHHIFIRILTPKFVMQFKWFCRKRRVFERRLAWCHVSGVSLSNTNRAFLADVVRNVGFTANSFAILTGENPDSLGLKGYQLELVRCTVSVMGYDGTCSEVSVERFLTQFGVRRPCNSVDVGLRSQPPNIYADGLQFSDSP